MVSGENENDHHRMIETHAETNLQNSQYGSNTVTPFTEINRLQNELVKVGMTIVIG